MFARTRGLSSVHIFMFHTFHTLHTRLHSLWCPTNCLTGCLLSTLRTKLLLQIFLAAFIFHINLSANRLALSYNHSRAVNSRPLVHRNRLRLAEMLYFVWQPRSPNCLPALSVHLANAMNTSRKANPN